MIKTLKQKVIEVLKKYPETRNDDILLTTQIWREFYWSHLEDDKIALRDLHKVPREDHVKRIRAKIQNEEGLYLPTSWIVAKKRNINEDVWREYLGYNTGSQQNLF